MVKKISNPYGNLKPLLNETEKMMVRVAYISCRPYEIIKFLGKRTKEKPVKPKGSDYFYFETKDGNFAYPVTVIEVYEKRKEILRRMVKQLHPRSKANKPLNRMFEYGTYNTYMTNNVIDDLQLLYNEIKSTDFDKNEKKSLLIKMRRGVIEPFLNECFDFAIKSFDSRDPYKNTRGGELRRNVELTRAIELVTKNKYLRKRTEELLPCMDHVIALYEKYLRESDPAEMKQELKKYRNSLADKDHTLREIAEIYNQYCPEPQKVRADMMHLRKEIICNLLNVCEKKYDKFFKEIAVRNKRLKDTEKFWNYVLDEGTWEKWNMPVFKSLKKNDSLKLVEEKLNEYVRKILKGNKVLDISKQSEGYLELKFKDDITSNYLEMFSEYFTNFLKNRTGKEAYMHPSYNRMFFSSTGDAAVFVRDNKFPLHSDKIEIIIRCNHGLSTMKDVSVSSQKGKGAELVDEFYEHMKHLLNSK